MNITISKIAKAYCEKGPSHLITKGKNYVCNKISTILCKLFCFTRGYFKFRGKKYRYFCHGYNTTWLNERTIEIPIIWKIVKQYKDKEILEVGNVLSHYFPVQHDVVDKYEKAAGVINEDIVNFQSPKKYDLIVSISTLEHLDYDEDPREPIWKQNRDAPIYESTKILRAIQNLKRLLVPGGKMVITLPLGYNPIVDKLVANNKLSLSEGKMQNAIYYLKRAHRVNKWKEATMNECQEIKYDFVYHFARAIIIVVYYNGAK